MSNQSGLFVNDELWVFFDGVVFWPFPLYVHFPAYPPCPPRRERERWDSVYQKHWLCISVHFGCRFRLSFNPTTKMSINLSGILVVFMQFSSGLVFSHRPGDLQIFLGFVFICLRKLCGWSFTYWSTQTQFKLWLTTYLMLHEYNHYM